jgi:hypothetical protein
MRKVIQRTFNLLAKKSIKRQLPGVIEELEQYSKKSNTTGTQWITLWMAIKKITQNKPAWILESGTGASTLVLAATVARLRQQQPDYRGHIVSMESLPEWLETAKINLPEKYKDLVDIVYGPRIKYEMAMFRGYIHSNIPERDYSFILIDGPAFQDNDGIAFCADLFKIMEFSKAEVIHGVSDGRASTVWAIQQLYGHKACRYWHGLYAGHFSVPKINPKEATLNTPKHFKTHLNGLIEFIKFRT